MQNSSVRRDRALQGVVGLLACSPVMPVKRRNHGRSRKGCGSYGKLLTCDGTERPRPRGPPERVAPRSSGRTRARHSRVGAVEGRAREGGLAVASLGKAVRLAEEVTGSSRLLACYRAGCGCRVSKDKGVKRFRVTNIVESSAIRDIRDASMYEEYVLPKMYRKMEYCIGCAIHQRVVRVRSVEARKDSCGGAVARLVASTYGVVIVLTAACAARRAELHLCDRACWSKSTSRATRDRRSRSPGAAAGMGLRALPGRPKYTTARRVHPQPRRTADLERAEHRATAVRLHTGPARSGAATLNK
eukprot:scaffold1584_cov363-Prasinococcus_capsulatus_cf.AAC.2